MIKIKLNVDLLGFKAGRIIRLATNDSGKPADQFWRNRLKDSSIDNCVEIVKEEKKKSKSKGVS